MYICTEKETDVDSCEFSPKLEQMSSQTIIWIKDECVKYLCDYSVFLVILMAYILFVEKLDCPSCPSSHSSFVSKSAMTEDGSD